MSVTSDHLAIVDATRMILDRNGNPCPAATSASYPLQGFCSECGARVRCADGTADWAHA